MNQKTAITGAAWALLFLLALIWGGSFLAIRTALDEIPFLTSVAWRVGIAAALLWLVVAVRGDAIPREPRIWGALLVMGILNNVIPFTFMAWGQLFIPTGLTAILNATTAVFGVIVAAAILPDERLTRRRIAGVSLGFAGVVLVIGPGLLGGLDPASLGQIAVIAGTLSYAFAGVWARLRLSNLTPLVAAAGMLTGSSLIVIPLALVMDGPPEVALAPVTWAAIGYYAAIATAFAYLLYYRILALAGSGNLLLVTLMIPPVAIVLGAVVRGEVLSVMAFAGFAVLALGLAILDGRILALFKTAPAR
ncbi:MAG: DMT family transporter [Rubricella sp.]